MQFNIIGTGRLGLSLAFSLLKQNDNTLVGVCNRSLASSEKAIARIGFGKAVASIHQLPKSEIIFITTPDDTLREVIKKLDELDGLSNQIIVHCSGVHSSDLLGTLKEKGCYIASFHPFKPFPLEPSDNEFYDCDCVLEGDTEAILVLKKIFMPLGAQLTVISAEKKVTYHAGAVMASNYLVALAKSAQSLLEDADIASQTARNMLMSIMQDSLDNIVATEEFKDALTGPLKRGDLDTIKQHLETITDPNIRAFYKAAGQITLSLTKHDQSLLSKFQKLFSRKRASNPLG